MTLGELKIGDRFRMVGSNVAFTLVEIIGDNGRVKKVVNDGYSQLFPLATTNVSFVNELLDSVEVDWGKVRQNNIKELTIETIRPHANSWEEDEDSWYGFKYQDDSYDVNVFEDDGVLKAAIYPVDNKQETAPTPLLSFPVSHL